MSRAVPELVQVRHDLEVWGRWWRRQMDEECANTSGHSAYSVFQEVMVLGTRVQKTNTRAHMMRSSAIEPPDHIVELGEFIEQLPEAQQAILSLWYVHGRGRRDKRPGLLLRAELAVASNYERIDSWAEREDVRDAMAKTRPSEA